MYRYYSTWIFGRYKMTFQNNLTENLQGMYIKIINRIHIRAGNPITKVDNRLNINSS